MKIPTLPQVEFDSFPTDEVSIFKLNKHTKPKQIFVDLTKHFFRLLYLQSTKVCIFTKLPYPIPDLSHVIKDGRKLVLYCTESTVLTVARFAKVCLNNKM